MAAWSEVQPASRNFVTDDGTYKVTVTQTGEVTLSKFIDGSFQPQGGTLDAPDLAFVKELFVQVGALLP